MKNKSKHYSLHTESSITPVPSVTIGFIQNLLFSLVIISIIFSFVVRLVNVDGVSMNTTLLNGDKVVVSEMFSAYKCGDIIVADCTDTLGKAVVKRVIAAEGQSLSIDYEGGEIAVDGVVLDEPYISSPTDIPTDPWNIPSVIPEGFVFVMGDNRTDSLDSRDNRMQLIPISSIVGKAEFVIFPFNRIKYLY